MESYPAVVLIGARQVGKSTLLKQLFPEAKLFDLEDEQDFLLVENDSAIVFKDNSKPILFDEAQLSNKLFKALRVEIDKTKKNGQFLLSGSSSPELLSNICESLAGRIAIVEIPSFNFSESHSTKLSELFENFKSIESIKDICTVSNEEDIFESCLYGGYPRPFLERKNLDFFDSWFSNYYKTYIERDIRSLFPGLKIESFKKFIKILARSSGNIINYSDFARTLEVSQPTVKNYFDIADGTFIWRKLPSFDKSSKKTLLKMPKGHFRDSGLLCYLLGIHSIDDLKNNPLFGRIWESFLIEQIIKLLGISYSKYEYFYYRTKAKAEIDLVIQGRFGLIPIEIKSGIQTNQKQLITLKNFIKEHQSPFALVVNRGQDVKLLADKVLQVPVTFL